MNLDVDSTLADLAVRVPAASRIFKSHRLDFCCSGQRSLAQACRERGLDPNQLLAQIETETASAAAAAPAFPDCATLIDHIIVRYHEPLRRELPELVALARRVEARHGDKPECPRGLTEHLAAMYEDVQAHLDKEERVLFPMLRAHAGHAAAAPISVMHREHSDHGASLRRTRELTDDLRAPAGACPTWQALYLRLEELESELFDHIHLENNVLFVRALADAGVTTGAPARGGAGV